MQIRFPFFHLNASVIALLRYHLWTVDTLQRLAI